MGERADLTQRLGPALDGLDGVDDPSPHDVAAVAGRARARAASRRRTRSRAVVGGVVLAVLVAVLPLALLRGGADPGPASGGGWRTVDLTLEPLSGSTRPVLVDVPAGWVPTATGCSLDVAPAGGCDRGQGLSLVPDTGTQDFAFGPGLHAADDGDPAEGVWSGYVTVGDDVTEGYAIVADDDRQAALRVLGSVRSPGEDLPDLAGEWPVTAERGVVWAAPVGVTADVGPPPSWNGPRGGFGYRGFAGPTGDGSWGALMEVGDVALQVVAPTRALAEVVAGSAGPDDAARPVGSWTTRTVDGVTLDVPAGWVRLDTGACRAGQTRFGPLGTEPCATPAPLAVFGGQLFDPAGPPGLDSGYVLAGEQVVTAEGDPEVVRRVLASARASGEDPGELGEPWEQRTNGGVTWAQPPGADVDVRVRSGYPDCTAGPRPAVQRPDGSWAAGYCRNRIVSVTAPTQALADVVASTVDDTGTARPGVDDWRTVELDDVALDVPAGWVRLGQCRDRLDPVRLAPAGTDVCTRTAPVEVFATDSPQAGALQQPGLHDGVSLVYSGDSVVVARGDGDTERRVLASVRQPGEDPGSLDARWERRSADGLTWLQPPGADVDVAVVPGGCPRTGLARQAVTGWVATYCGSRVATVTASTQALADLVASTVDA